MVLVEPIEQILKVTVPTLFLWLIFNSFLFWEIGEKRNNTLIIMKKLFLIPILLIPLLIGSSGCDPDGDGKLECDQISMFCDIASSMIGTISANPIIPIATSFVVKGVVTNLEYQGKCEEPKNPATSETHTGYEVQYYTGNKSTDDDGWETIAFTDTEGNATELLSIYTQSLLANQDANINNSYEFEAAGQYRFIQNADHLNEEPDERDNENNGLY